MTTETNAHLDQASPTKKTAGDHQEGEAVSARSELSRPSDETELQRAERQRRSNSLGIGAPLTAAFIGGFLVIENLAGADTAGESGVVTLPDDVLFPEGEDDEAGTAGDGAGDNAGLIAGEVDSAGHAQDPDAAPSEDVAVAGGPAGGAAAASMPTAAGLVVAWPPNGVGPLVPGGEGMPPGSWG